MDQDVPAPTTASPAVHPDPSRNIGMIRQGNLMSNVSRSYLCPHVQPSRRARDGEDWAVIAADIIRDRCAIASGAPMPVDISAEHVASIAPRDRNGRVRIDELYRALGRYPALCVRPTGAAFRCVDSYGLVLRHPDLTEQNMRLELEERGPVHLVLRAAPELVGYRGGVLEEQRRRGQAGVDAWVSARLVGWNAENPASAHWVIHMPWGPDWGPYGGRLYLRMGGNHLSAEACAWAPVPAMESLVDPDRWAGRMSGQSD